MCGIVGYVGTHRPELLEPMCQALAHRGPDDQGSWFDSEAGVGLGHRRLSVIDPSPAGHQPMSSADQSVWISYNGELYNFAEQRERLESEGYAFRSQTDTEVLIALYQKHGLDFLDQLNGMFALALWDARRKRLVLARDHAGIKPLYYHLDGHLDGCSLYFASELKALLTIPGLSRELHLPSLRDYLQLLWVPGEHTLLEGVKKLEPGHCLIWEDGAVQVRRWFTLRYDPDPGVREDAWVEQVHDTLLRTTRRQMVSDVPLGAFLSGGLDSSSIVACMRQVWPTRDIDAYTVRFKRGDMAREQGEDDHPHAEAVAAALGVRLRSVHVEPDVIQQLLPKMVYHLDEPDADPAVFPSYLIAKLAQQDGKRVLLSGTGGDEVLFGYRSHLAYKLYGQLPWLEGFPAAQLLSSLGSLSQRVLGTHNRHARRLAKFSRGLCETGLARHLALSDWSSLALRERIVEPELGQAMDLGAVPAAMQRAHDAFEGTGELNRHSHLLIQSFLAAHNFLYTDKSSMAASLEVRVPFLDLELMRLCARIPEACKLQGRTTKVLLRKAMAGLLPESVLGRGKTGFGVPLRSWLRRDLQPLVRALLGAEQLSKRGLFRPSAVAQLLDENELGRADHSYLIYALINLELWQQTFLDRPGVEVTL